MKISIFYCWQSDSPGKTNRYLIGNALGSAIETVTSRGFDLVFDQASEGVRGLVSIPDHIRAKLDQADIFVADITPVARVPDSGKVMPNGNVLYELGCVESSLRSRGLDPLPIILIMNTASGTPRDAPFDLGWRPVITYQASKEATDGQRRKARRHLASALEGAIRSILEGGSLFYGLSPEAFQLARYLNKTWQEGLVLGSAYSADELEEASDLSRATIEQGAPELLERGYLTEMLVPGFGAGWPVQLTEKLFLDFDSRFQEWDPEVDAKRILEEIGSQEGLQITTPEIEDRFGWGLRRLEVAQAWLVRNGLARRLDEVWPPYRYARLEILRRASFFLRHPGTIA